MEQTRLNLGDMVVEAAVVAQMSKPAQAVITALKARKLSGRFWEVWEKLQTEGYTAEQAAVGAFYATGRKGRNGINADTLGGLIGKSRQWITRQMSKDGTLSSRVETLKVEFWDDRVADIDERLYEKIINSYSTGAAEYRLAYERAGVLKRERDEEKEDAHALLMQMLANG